MRQNLFRILINGEAILQGVRAKAKSSFPKLTEAQSHNLETASSNVFLGSIAYLWGDMIWHGYNDSFTESMFSKCCAGAVKEFGEDAVILAL